MKILFIYHNYIDRRKRYGYLLAAMGHKVIFKDVGAKTAGTKVDKSLLSGVDLVFAQNSAYTVFGQLGKKFLDELASKNIPMCCYSTVLTERTPQETVEICKPFTFVFEHTPEVVVKLKETDPEHAEKYHWLPHGFHPEQFYPMQAPKKYDIVFCGSPQERHTKRMDMLKRVAKRYPGQLHLFGNKLCRWFGIPQVQYNTPDQERKIYARSKLCLNLPYYDSTQDWLRAIAAPNDRFFEIPACGGVQLTEYGPYLEQMFEPGKECFYFRDGHEMMTEIDRILKDWGSMAAVGDAAHKRAMAEHTYGHRLERMMAIVQGQSRPAYCGLG